MRFYLSSYKLGNKVEQFKQLFPKNKKTAYIPNALDFSTDLERREKGIIKDIEELENLGLKVEVLDLRDYFNNFKKLKKKIKEFGVIWVRGGNLFVLRKAMKLSGFDIILKELTKKDILYGGYSAGICILAPTLKGIDLIDDLTANPYKDSLGIIWDGLNIIDYSIVPHYKSEHPESKDADKAVEYLKKHKLPFKTLKDGEVLIL